jgi:hypothetical protein
MQLNRSYYLLRLLVAFALDAAFVRAARALTNLPILFILSIVIHIVNDPVYGYTANYKHNSPKYIGHSLFKHISSIRAIFLVKYKYFCRNNGSES